MGFASYLDKIEKLRTDYFGLMLETHEAKFNRYSAPPPQLTPQPQVIEPPLKTIAEAERAKDIRVQKLRELAILGLIELRPSGNRKFNRAA